MSSETGAASSGEEPRAEALQEKRQSTLRAINLRILHGDLTVSEAIDSHGVSVEEIRSWQAQYLVLPEAKKPWEHVIERFWAALTRGWRRYLTLPLFFLFFGLPFVATFYDTGIRLWKEAVRVMPTKFSEMEPSELDVCNEWVARIERFDSKDDARKEREALLVAMKEANEWTWVDDILITRDIDRKGHYLLLIDMFPGPSTSHAVSAEIERLRNSGDKARQNKIGNALQGAKPFYYRKSLFEKLYGRLSPNAGQCRYPEQT